MREEQQPISRMEMYSGSLVTFVGIFYLMAILGPLFQQRSALPVSFFTPQQFKMIFFVIFYITGGVLFFLARKPGWVFCAASLLNIVLITAFLLFDSLKSGLNRYQLIPFLFFLLSLLALGFMFNKEVRVRQGVMNRDYLLMLAFYFALLLLTYKV